MNNQLYESKLWEAITAIASGIMTSLLYDLVSQTSYVIVQEGAHYVIVSSSDNTPNTVLAFFIILLLFFSLWGILNLIVCIGVKTFRQLKFKKRKRIDGRSLLEIFNNAKEQTTTLINVLENEKNLITCKNSATLHIRDLAVIITSLHDKFCKRNLHGKAYAKNYFRCPKHASIVTISEGISRYEFLSLLGILDKLVRDITTYAENDELMLQDCNELSVLLSEITVIGLSTE